MNKILVFTYFIFTLQVITGQRKHWTNDLEEKSKKGQATRFYTIKKEKTSNLFLKEYYLYDKKIPYETTYFKTKKCIIKQGESKTFYPNGNLRELGNYTNNNKSGEWILFNSNKVKHKVVNYVKGQKHGVFFKYEDGKITSGAYKNDLKDQLWSVTSASGTSIETIFYKAGKRHGKSTYYHNNGKVREVKAYQEGILLNSRRFDSNGLELIEEEMHEEEFSIFMTIDEQPEFPGGSSKMMRYIGNKVQYPQIAIENKIEGRVYIRFIVEKDGSISNVEAIRSPHESLEKEAVRVVSSMPKWTPAKQKGKNVRAQFTLPINFRLH